MVGSGVGTWLGPGWQGGHLHMPVAPRFAPLGLSLRKPDLGTPVGPQGPCTLSPSEWHPFQVGPPAAEVHGFKHPQSRPPLKGAPLPGSRFSAGPGCGLRADVGRQRAPCFLRLPPAGPKLASPRSVGSSGGCAESVLFLKMT